MLSCGMPWRVKQSINRNDLIELALVGALFLSLAYPLLDMLNTSQRIISRLRSLHSCHGNTVPTPQSNRYVSTPARSVGGKVFVLGDNVEGQLGITGPHCFKATMIEGIPEIKSMSAGHLHTMLVDTEGGVWGFGASTFGETGLGVDLELHLPLKIEIDTKFVDVAAGKTHTLFLTEYGDVYSCGDGESRQLGYVFEGPNGHPRKIDALKGVNVKTISCGSMHSFAIDDKGHLYSWGGGHYAQHGHGYVDMVAEPQRVNALSNERVSLVAAGLYHSVIVTESQKVYVFGSHKTKVPGANLHRMNYFLQPILVKGTELVHPEEKWTHVTSGITHSVLSSNKGRTLAWGINIGYCVGTDTPAQTTSTSITTFDTANQLHHLNGVIFNSLASGSYHNIGCDTQGQCWGWGQGSDYQLGTPDRHSIERPSKINLEIPKDFTISKVAAGWAHTLILANKSSSSL